LPISKFNRKPLLKSIIAAAVEPRITKVENIAPVKVEIGNKMYFLNPIIR